jgi:hypothetical protein
MKRAKDAEPTPHAALARLMDRQGRDAQVSPLTVSATPPYSAACDDAVSGCNLV